MTDFSASGPPAEPSPMPGSWQALVTAAGLALMQCQLFESSMRVLLAYAQESGAIRLGSGSGDELLEALGKKTAGQLAAILRSDLHLEDEGGVIQAALAGRNRIMHSFFVDNADRIFDEESRRAVLMELEDLAQAVTAGEAFVSPHARLLAAALDGTDYVSEAKSRMEETLLGAEPETTVDPAPEPEDPRLP